MQEIRRDPTEPDRITQHDTLGSLTAAVERAVTDPGTREVRILKPGDILEIQQGPFAGRRYRLNDRGQLVRVREIPAP